MDRHGPSVHHARAAWRDPVVVAVGAVTAVLCVRLLTGSSTDPITGAVGPLLTCGFLVVGAVTALRLVTRQAPSDPWRTVWRSAAWSALACGAGLVADLAARHVAPGPAAAGSSLAVVLYDLGGLLALVALLGHPLEHPLGHPLEDGSRAAAERIRSDAVMVTAAVAAAWSTLIGGLPSFTLRWNGFGGLAVLLALTYGLTRIRLAPARRAGFPWLVVGLVATASTGGSLALTAGLAHHAWSDAVTLAGAALVLVGARGALTQVDGRAVERPARNRAGAGQGAGALVPVTLAVCLASVVVVHLRAGAGSAGLVAMAAVALVSGLVLRRQRSLVRDRDELLERWAQVVGERDELAALFRRTAYEDPLTSVANRSRFTAELAAAQGESARRGTAVAVLLIDLDDFKPVNDRFGHAAGDAVLRECAARMEACLGPGDLLARIGGDEFAVVLPQSYKLAATALGERIVAELSRPIAIGGGVSVRIGASVGVSATTAGGRSPEALLRDADHAMYRAKERGKGAVAVY